LTSAATVTDRPGSGNDACRLISEEFEKTFSKVKTAVRASRTPVCNLSGCSFAVISHGNRLEAPASLVILSRVQRNGKVRGSVDCSTRAKASGEEGPARIIFSFENLNIVSGSFGEFMVVTACGMSMGVGERGEG
jgi:hypothetical protein